MATCDELTRKGGIHNDDLEDLHIVVMKPQLEILAAYYKRTILEKEAHRQTLILLGEIIAGDIDPATVIVNPDGWLIKAPRPNGAILPVEEVSPNGYANTADPLNLSLTSSP
mgnify:CR=1 FL=1